MLDAKFRHSAVFKNGSLVPAEITVREGVVTSIESTDTSEMGESVDSKISFARSIRRSVIYCRGVLPVRARTCEIRLTSEQCIILQRVALLIAV